MADEEKKAAAPGEANEIDEDADEALDIDWRARALELEHDNATLKDRLLRALAEAENDRRRALRDREDAAKFGGTKLARDILSVFDNLDRTLKGADDSVKTAAKDFFEGVEITRGDLLAAFGRHQIEAVTPPMGAKFDPNLHQAMFEAPIPGAEPGTVIQVLQTGFTIAGRLLRPALVGVAKAGAAAPPPPAASEAEPEAPEEEHSAAARPNTPPPPPPRPGAAKTRRD